MLRGLRGEQPLGVEDPLVAQRIVLAAEAAQAEVGQGFAIQRVLGVVDRPGVVARVLEEAADQRLAVGELPGELAGAEVAVALALDRAAGERPGGEGAGQLVVHPVVGAEEPEAVLDQVAAEVDPEVLAGEAGGGAVVRHHRLGVALQGIVVVVAEEVAVEFVAARLGDHVHDAARRVPELGLVAAGLDVHRLDELEVELLALEAVLGAGGIDAVDVVDVLGAARAVDGDRRLVRVLRVGVRGDAGGDLHHRGVVAAGRQRLDRPRVEVQADRGAGGVDHRRVAGHRDLSREGGAQAGVELGVLAEGDADPLAGLGGEAVEVEGDRVVPRRQEIQVIAAVAVGHRRARPLEGGAGRLDSDAGEHAAPLVGDPADDAAGGLGSGGRRGREEREKKSERQQAAAQRIHRDLLRTGRTECEENLSHPSPAATVAAS